MPDIRLFAIFLSISLATSSGSASSVACSEVFQGELLTAVRVQNIAQQNFKTKIKTTGYESVEQIRERMQSGGYYNDINPASLVKKFAASLRAPEGIREKLLSEGFKNQHQLKARGTENLEKMIDTESGIVGLSKSDFAAIPEGDKPLYAALLPRPEYLSGRNRNLDRYGDDLWITRHEVMARATWTTTDSWALKNDFMGLGWDKKVKSFEDRDWTHIAMPADTLDLAIPFLTSGGQVRFPSKRGGGISQSFYRGQIMPPMNGGTINFIEFQIWGGLKPNNISDFVFYKTPPTIEQLRAFEASGIRVWDGRQDGPPVLVQP